MHFNILSRQAKHIFKCTVSVLMCCILACSTIVIAFGSSSSDLAAAQKKLQELNKSATSAKEKLDAQYDVYYAICDQVDAAQDKVDAVQSKINTINNKIAKIQAKIDAKNKEIAALQAKIDKQQKEMDEKYNAFKNRLKAIYISGNVSSLEALLSCDDFSTYLTRLEMIKKVSDKDGDVIQELEKLVEEMNKMKANLDKDKKTLEDDKAEVQTQKDELVKQRSALQEQRNALASKKSDASSALSECESTLAGIEASQKSYQSKIDKIKAQMQNTHSSVVGTGRFCYPVPSCTTVSCGYYGYANHNGVDFANGNAYGLTVVAADAGTVVGVYYWNYSYGYHVIINHGNGFITYYCHMSNITVSQGQKVSKGQQVGNVGETGHAYGAHLHFGVLLNGNWVNPMSYL